MFYIGDLLFLVLSLGDELIYIRELLKPPKSPKLGGLETNSGVGFHFRSSYESCSWGKPPRPHLSPSDLLRNRATQPTSLLLIAF